MHTKMWSDMFLLSLPVDRERSCGRSIIYLFLDHRPAAGGQARDWRSSTRSTSWCCSTLSNTVQNAIIGERQHGDRRHHRRRNAARN